MPKGVLISYLDTGDCQHGRFTIDIFHFWIRRFSDNTYDLRIKGLSCDKYIAFIPTRMPKKQGWETLKELMDVIRRKYNISDSNHNSNKMSEDKVNERFCYFLKKLKEVE